MARIYEGKRLWLMVNKSSPLRATMAVCFLSMAAAVSDKVTMTSRASCLCMLVRLESAHS